MESVERPQKSIRLFVVILFVSLAAFVPQPSQARQRQEQLAVDMFNGKRVVAKQVLVKFKESASRAKVESVKRSLDIAVDRSVGGLDVRLYESRTVEVSTLLKSLAALPEVLYVEPNYVYRLDNAPNDPRFSEQPSLLNLVSVGADIGALAAWDLTTGSTKIVVGIIDSGIDYNHPDLVANLWSAPNPFTVTIGGRPITCGRDTHGFNALTNTCDPLDDNDHGTHVSGTIGAVGNNRVGLTGINWVTRLMAMKICDASGANCPVDAQINAIEFAIQAKAAFAATGAADVRVLNNSYGGLGFSQALLDEINHANANNMLFVAAAGNDGTDNDSTPHYPSSYNAPNVIAVAATGTTDELAGFSNYGRTSVHLGAPGVHILSTIRQNNYTFFDGTSMATPHVAGAAALILSRTDINTAPLRNILLGNVDTIPSLVNKTITGGRLNLDRAIREATSSPDFVLAAGAPPPTVIPGGGASCTITLTPRNGFSGVVSFSVKGLPTGAQAQFSPATVTSQGNTTLTVKTTGATVGGTYPLTVVGRSSNLETRTAVVQLSVADFTLSAIPLAQTINPGTTAQFSVSVIRQGGFSAPINLAVSGLPPNATASFSPPIVPGVGPSNLNITAAVNTPPGRYDLVISGVGDGVQRTLTVGLSIADFSVTALGAADGIRRGDNTGFFLQATPIGGFTGVVDLSVTGLPPNSTATFDPPSVTLINSAAGSRLKINTANTTPNGLYNLVVTAMSGGLKHSTNLSLLIATYSVVEIPPLPDRKMSGAMSINNQGIVAGIAADTSFEMFEGEGFIFDSSTARPPTSVGICAGGNYSKANAINNSGIVVGVGSVTGSASNAFMKAPGPVGNIKCLGSFPGRNQSIANSINDFPMIVGSAFYNAAGLSHAFVYTELGGFEDIGTIGNRGTRSMAFGINNAGNIVGASDTGPGTQFSAFYYSISQGSAPRQLPDLGGNLSYAYAINDLDHIVGISATATEIFPHAFLIDGTGIHDIGASIGARSEAHAINRSDQVVGHFVSSISGCSSATPCRAFFYSRGVFVDLNRLIPQASGWVLQEGRGINDGGRIVGIGTLNGQTRGFVAIPEP